MNKSVKVSLTSSSWACDCGYVCVYVDMDPFILKHEIFMPFCTNTLDLSRKLIAELFPFISFLFHIPRTMYRVRSFFLLFGSLNTFDISKQSPHSTLYVIRNAKMKRISWFHLLHQQLNQQQRKDAISNGNENGRRMVSFNSHMIHFIGSKMILVNTSATDQCASHIHFVQTHNIQ